MMVYLWKKNKIKRVVEGVMVDIYTLRLTRMNSSVITVATKIEINLKDYVASKRYIGP